MTEEKLTEKRDGQNVIALRQDGKRKWSIASAGMGEASTRFLYGEHADKLAEYEEIGTPEECRAAVKFKQYFDELYGNGLEVTNWHQNGDTEPFDSFYESALDWSKEE